MGLTSSKVRLSGPSGSRELELLVDTGSSHTWVSKNLLKTLGIEPLYRAKFKTMSGKLSRRVGEAVMEIEGRRATRIVVFADDSDAQVLGVDALEGLGFEVDPVAKKLKKTEYIAAY